MSFWLTRKDNALVSELIDGEPSVSKGVVESDLEPTDGQKNTLLKSKGMRSGGKACWAYFTEHVRTENLKRVTYCCVQNEKGEQCIQALNITTVGIGSMVNQVQTMALIYSRDCASHHQQQLLLQSHAVRQEKCDELFLKPYKRESTA